jgi:hypothetical protein
VIVPTDAGAAKSRTSAKAAVAGEVAVPITRRQVPVAVVSVVLSWIASWTPPVQLPAANQATRMRALPMFVPVGTKIQPSQA